MTSRFQLAGIITSETINARQGIETCVIAPLDNIFQKSETINARQGIETFMVYLLWWVGVGSETINARQEGWMSQD